MFQDQKVTKGEWNVVNKGRHDRRQGQTDVQMPCVEGLLGEMRKRDVILSEMGSQERGWKTLRASQVVLVVKNLTANARQTQV